jgi:hypothetical protein
MVDKMQSQDQNNISIGLQMYFAEPHDACIAEARPGFCQLDRFCRFQITEKTV